MISCRLGYSCDTRVLKLNPEQAFSRVLFDRDWIQCLELPAAAAALVGPGAERSGVAEWVDVFAVKRAGK